MEFMFQEILVDSRLSSEETVFCFLFSSSRCVLLLDASASRINLLKLLYCPLKSFHIDIYKFYCATRLIDLN